MNNDKCKSLPKLLAKECWTLRQRLDYSQVLNLSEYVNESHQLDEWSKIVAPNQTENFIKRLEWSGYTPNQALWALNPPEEAVTAHPNWLDLLTFNYRLKMLLKKYLFFFINNLLFKKALYIRILNQVKK